MNSRGQGAKTGTGGHLPGNKVQGKIAEVRGLEPGEAAISPSTFPDLNTAADFRKLADEVRERSGGIPIGFKLSANRIEDDIEQVPITSFLMDAVVVLVPHHFYSAIIYLCQPFLH